MTFPCQDLDTASTENLPGVTVRPGKRQLLGSDGTGPWRAEMEREHKKFRSFWYLIRGVKPQDIVPLTLLRHI